MTELLPADLARLQGYVDAGTSRSTRRAYAQSWAAWVAWCAARATPPLPAAPELVAAWFAELAQAGRRPSTLDRHLAAISAAHHAASLPSPRTHPALRAVLRGIRRTHGSASRQVAPLRVEDLRAALPRGDDPRALRDRALLLLGFAAALRRSELVALDLADLDPRAEGLVLTLRASKTDPERHGELVAIPYARRPELCAVRAVAAWRVHVDGGALFRPVDRHGHIGGTRLSDRAVADVVKEAATRAGLDPLTFSGHSLRAGFATSAAAAGLPEREIMRQTRHRSVAVFRGYVRKGSLFVDNPAGRLL